MAELLEKELVFRIIGCAMAVHNALGHGLGEKTKVGVIINYKHRKLEWARLVLDEAR